MKLQIAPKLLPVLDAKQRFVVVYGGRGSGKSYGLGSLSLLKALNGQKVGAFREFQNSIDDSVHSLLAAQIESYGLDAFEVQNNQILFNGEVAFKFRGLARNVEAVKSMFGFNLFWIEEAQTISFESLKALTPTLREQGSQIWLSGNPRSSTDAFSERFIKPFEKQLERDGIYEDDMHLVIRMNYEDNPWFVKTPLEQERLHDRQNLPRAMYEHIWEGKHLDTVQDSIIEADWFDAAVDAHKKLGWKPEGLLMSSHDPSDEGGDSKGYALRHGNVILDVCEKVTGDANEGMDWALDKAIAAQADHFIWDCDGLGISLKRQVDQALDGKKMEYHMFKGSESPYDPEMPYTLGGSQRAKTNRETFFNKRAQMWWTLRDRFEATYRAVEKGQYINPEELISLSSDIDNLEQLRSEVCRIPLKRANSGKIQILSKVEMAKKPYSIPSPNMGDALMMSMHSPKVSTVKPVTINFAGWKNGRI